MRKENVLVYVQAVPVAIPRSARTFEDLEQADFQLTHSSKVALAWAAQIPDSEITATGYAPILNEALARGAANAIPVPLCVSVTDQARLLPTGEWLLVVLGENPEGPFEGITFAGTVAEMRNVPCLIKERSWNYDVSGCPPGSILVLRDDGLVAGRIDVRRIVQSSKAEFEDKKIIGSAQLKIQDQRTNKPLTGEPQELAETILKRLNRFSN